MFPTGRLKSRKSTLGTRTNCLGIEPVRLILPAASVKSKLGRSLRKNDLQAQIPLLRSASRQGSVYNAKKCLFGVNKENQEQSETISHDSYEDISGIHEMVSSDSCHKNSYCVDEREASRKASSILTLRQDFLYSADNINLTNRSEHKPVCSQAYKNLEKHHDKDQLLPLPNFLFPLNRICSVSEDKFLNKNHELNLQSKLIPQKIDDTANVIPDVESTQTNDGIKKCKKTADCTPQHDTNLPNYLIINKNNTDVCTEEMNSNEHILLPELLESSTCPRKQEVNSKENINNDSILSFTLNEITCISNESEAGSLTKCSHDASFSKNQLPNKRKQTTESMERRELLIPESRCKCYMNIDNRVEAVVSVIENTQTYIQSIEKKIVEELRNSVRQLDIIKYDLTNKIPKNNRCLCECCRNKILNVPSNLNHIKSDMKKLSPEDKLQAKNCSISKTSIGAKDSKNSLGSFNESECKDEGQNISHSVLSTSVPYCKTPDIAVKENALGNKAVLVKNVSFKIPHRTPVSSRKKTKVYSNYKSHYNMCVKTPESSVKLRRQLNRSLVLTPHSMSNRLSTQIGNLFQS